MIHSITVKDIFQKAEGAACIGHLSGYALPSLPKGHQLKTDSYVVVLIGDNGSGKTTLLQKLASQYKFPSVIPEYFECDSSGQPVRPKLVEYDKQMNVYGYSVVNPEKLREDPNLPKYSQGQFRFM